jgi:hypothetical protein
MLGVRTGCKKIRIGEGVGFDKARVKYDRSGKRGVRKRTLIRIRIKARNSKSVGNS